MEVWAAKLLLFFGLFFETIIFGLVPLFVLNKISENTRITVLGLANAFSGGIFLSSGFIHLLGEGVEAINESLHTEFPLALLCTSIGFLVTFFLEKVVLFKFHTHDHGSEKQKQLQSHPEEEEQQDLLRPPTPPPKSFVAFTLLIALSIHSTISGFALGVQQKMDHMVPIAVAIVSHKWVEAIAVSVALIRQNTPKWRVIILIAIYSVMESLGLIIGFAVSSVIGKHIGLLEGIVSAVAAGTFIYIAAIDILVPEFEEDMPHKGTKTLMCFAAFSLMTALVVVLPHEHGDDGSPSIISKTISQMLSEYGDKK